MAYRYTAFYKHLWHARTAFYVALFTAFVIGAFFTSVAVAQEKPSYTVSGVKVDVTADNAVEAREQAFEAAQVRAYEMLAARFMSKEEMNNFETPSLNKISSLVQNFEVTNEKLSATRYNGTYTISFRPHPLGVKKPAQSKDTAKKQINTATSKTLILPIIQKDGRNYIWAQGPYRDAWQSIVAKDTTGQIILPNGDAEDRSAIRNDEALSYDYNRLARIIRKYQADQTMLVVANPQATKGGIPNVDVKLYRALPSGPSFMREISVPIYAGEMPDALFNRVASQSKIAIDNQMVARAKTPVKPAPSKAKPVTPTGPTKMITAQLNFSSMREWVDLKRSIERTNGISSLIVKSMSAQNAIIDIGYRGDLTALSQNLRQARLLLQSPINGTQNTGANSIYQLTRTR